MNNLSGGYIMVDLSSPNKVKQLEKAAALNKPLLVYYQDGTTEWGKVTVTYETVDDVEVPTYHITTANGFVTVEADGDVFARPLILEGDGVPLEQEGVTISYCKWSLTGTHLMLVVAGIVDSGTSIPSNAKLGTFNVPDYILNKVYVVFNNRIERKGIVFSSSDWSSQTLTIALMKENNLNIATDTGSATTITAIRNFRIQFDLLIDNE